ncbi:hypothetical protein HGRIS_014793 [Hohenbuehelia grisea]|uniref:PSP1 C-terminal domain-containing protein n=1 Tax=Hohenbuehelia grisea TaxID=104357 RepID=A0ABR3IQR6_9AGAR
MHQSQSATQHQHFQDEEDRQNRFLAADHAQGLGAVPLRERAASQPPRTSEQDRFSSPAQQHIIPSSLGGPGAPSWSGQRLLSPTRGGVPQPIPMRSSSFSSQPQAHFSSAMRDRAFASTFEDDESEFSDTYDDRFLPSSYNLGRGRNVGQDYTRSRSQSLANTRHGPVGSPYLPTPTLASWNDSTFGSNALNIPGSRYGEIKPPGSSRNPTDASNMSPFVRDVGQILLDDGSAFRELWAGINPPRDEIGGGGSGTTSRRHSVSVVQPRRGNIVGFNAPGSEDPEEPSRPAFSQTGFSRGGLMLSDEELASDLGMLNLGPSESLSPPQPPSQPASLPIYAPLSRSPPSADRISQYVSLNQLNEQLGSSYSRQQLHTPSDNGPSNGSPPRGQFEQGGDSPYLRQAQQPQQQIDQSDLTARFIPGHGIQYLSSQQVLQGGTATISGYARERAPSYSGSMASPISPTASRPMHASQAQGAPTFFPPQIGRRPSNADINPPQAGPFHDLGKGLPLHAVPPSWPLFIVEFKAGRTDLFYLTDLSQEIRVGDLVIVEADRGKDLGKVVNDSITIAEVEAFQKQQLARASYGEPTSPGGGGQPSGKKEINPKMIYGKAQTADTTLLMAKMQDEMKALQLCQSKVRAKKLPMEVVDAEYQWDRRKLTFYFVAEKRIDFRELVRELFRLYKTRIWMASLQGGGGFEQ